MDQAPGFVSWLNQRALMVFLASGETGRFKMSCWYNWGIKKRKKKKKEKMGNTLYFPFYSSVKSNLEYDANTRRLEEENSNIMCRCKPSVFTVWLWFVLCCIFMFVYSCFCYTCLLSLHLLELSPKQLHSFVILALTLSHWTPPPPPSLSFAPVSTLAIFRQASLFGDGILSVSDVGKDRGQRRLEG